MSKGPMVIFTLFSNGICVYTHLGNVYKKKIDVEEFLSSDLLSGPGKLNGLLNEFAGKNIAKEYSVTTFAANNPSSLLYIEIGRTHVFSKITALTTGVGAGWVVPEIIFKFDTEINMLATQATGGNLLFAAESEVAYLFANVLEQFVMSNSELKHLYPIDRIESLPQLLKDHKNDRNAAFTYILYDK